MKPNRIYTTIIFCACFVLYAKTIGFDYSYFDDHHILIDHQSYFESKDIQRFFTTDPYLEHSTNYYRPIQTLSFLADVVVSGGLNPWMFHLTNTLLFGIIGCLLFFMLLKFNVPNRFAFIGTLIFCVHPIFVTAVAWIPARGDLLLTLFGVLSTIFFIKFTEQGKIKHLLIVWLTFTLALFSKETAALLPLLFLIYFLTIAPASHRKVTLRHILLGVFIGISGLVWLYARSLAISPGEPITLLKVFRNFLSIPVAFSQLLMLPIDFSPWPSFTPAKIVVGLCVMILLFFVIIKNTKKTFKEHLFYPLWFFILLFPKFLAIQGDTIDYIDHRFLLPMIGVLLWLLSLFPPLTKGYEKQRLSWRKDFIWMGVVAILGCISFYKTDVYRGAESYYDAIIRYNPENAKAYNNRGWWKQNIMEDIQGALEDYDQAIFYNDEDAFVYNNRGLLKIQHGDINGAFDDFNKAILYNPMYTPAYMNRGNCRTLIHNTKGALEDYNKAISLDSRNEMAYFSRGLLYLQTGALPSAIDDFDHAIQLNKEYSEAYMNRSIVHRMMGNYNDALLDVNRVIRIEPNDMSAYLNRVLLYLEMGDDDRALQDCNRVLTINPENEHAMELKNHILNKNETK